MNLPDREGARKGPAVSLTLRVLLVGFICYLIIEIVADNFPPHHISPLYPTNAILLSVLAVTPIRHWWAYALAALLSSVTHNAQAGVPALQILVFFVADIVEVFISAVGVHRFAVGLRSFDRVRSLVVYVITVVVASLIGASVAAGVAKDYWLLWRLWVQADVLAYLMVAPAILTCIAGARTTLGNASREHWIEACLIGCALLAVSLLVFSWSSAGEGSVPALVYLPLPLLLWAAVRFGPPGVSVSLLIVACVSISGAVRGYGPFTTSTPTENVFALQLFLIAISVPLMFLAALIEERRAKTNVLSESESRFRTMANAAPVMVWMSGADKLCTFFNKGWLDYTGRTLEQEVGNGWADGVHPNDFERCLEIYTDNFAARRPFTMEYRLRRFNGEYRWLFDRGVPRSDPDGAFLGYIGSCVDITELKRGEESFRLAVEASPSAMVMVNEQGRIVMVNEQAEKMFGYARAEVLGQSIEVLVPEQYRVAHPAHRAEFFAAPQARSMGVGRDLFGQCKDGTRIPVEIGLNPVQTSEGLFVLASISDITERRRAEREAAQQRSELAHLSRVSALGQLSASIAHQLNQPLAAILGNAEAAWKMLGRQPVDLVELREICSDIVSEDHRAAEVIARLSALFKRGEMPLEPLDLNELIRDTLALLQAELLIRHVTVVTDLARLLPVVEGGRVQLQQVLLNLVVNGTDAMGENAEGERKLVIRTGVTGTGVRICVSDCGRGIAAADLKNIFEPFWSSKPGGMGMGLAICRSIVTAHRGSLTAVNDPGGGATFCVSLPVRTEA